MKKATTILCLFFLSLHILEAQCNFKGVPRKIRRYSVSESKPNPDVATSLSFLFDRVYFMGEVGFAKEGGQYYLFLHLARAMSPSFELRPTNAMTLNTASGQQVVVYPNGIYKGGRLITWHALGCYFTLSKEQLQILATDKVASIQIQFPPETPITTRQDDGGSGWSSDAQGNVFFRHTIEADAKKEKCRNAANCLLQKG